MNSLPNFSKSCIFVKKIKLTSGKSLTNFQNIYSLREVDNIEYGIVTLRTYT